MKYSSVLERVLPLVLVSIVLFITVQPVLADTPSSKGFFSSESDQRRAVYISAATRIPYLSRIVDDLQSIGYTVDVIAGNNFTVEFLKENLGLYDVIIIRTGVIWHEGPYRLLTMEKVVDKTKYAEDLAEKRIYEVSQYYAVSINFFSYYYGNGGLDGKLIILLTSNMGMISSTLLRTCGARAVIGFSAPYLSLSWGTADLIIYRTIEYLCRGMTVQEAIRAIYWNVFLHPWEPVYPYSTLVYGGDGEGRLSIFQPQYS